MRHGPAPPRERVVAVATGHDDAEATRRRREAVREQIRDFANLRERQRAAAADFTTMRSEKRTARSVEAVCSNVDRLLINLAQELDESDRTVDIVDEGINQGARRGGAGAPRGGGGIAESPDPMSPLSPLNAGAIDDCEALRSLAADDASLEIASVADYSSEPPGAPAFGQDCLTFAHTEVEASVRKVLDSIETLTSSLTASPTWWTTPITSRRLKAHAIRVNYHARKIKKWSNQSRSHLFVTSSILNRATRDAAAELADLHVQLVANRQRKQVALAAKDEITAETARLHTTMDTLSCLQDCLDECLVHFSTSLFPLGVKQIEATPPAVPTPTPARSVTPSKTSSSRSGATTPRAGATTPRAQPTPPVVPRGWARQQGTLTPMAAEAALSLVLLADHHELSTLVRPVLEMYLEECI